MPINYKQFAISKLLSQNFVVYKPISKQSKEFDLIIEYAGSIETIAIISAYLSNNTTSTTLIAKLTKFNPPRLRNILLCSSYLIVYPSKGKIWLIPTLDLADITCISLNNRYDNYLLTNKYFADANNQTNEISQLTIQAKDMAKQLIKD